MGHTFPSVIILQMSILHEKQHSCKACKSMLMTSYISVKADAKKAQKGSKTKLSSRWTPKLYCLLLKQVSRTCKINE